MKSGYRKAVAKGRGALRSALNHRQVALIQHVLKHQFDEYTVKSHMRSHGVTYETARSDLLYLADTGLLEKTMRGRAFIFRAAENIRDRLKEMRDAA